MRHRALNAVPAVVLVAALLGAWEVYVDSGSTNSSILPAPHSIAVALWGNAGLLGHNLAITAEEVGLGLLLALALGFALAVLIHLSPILRRAVYPLAVGSQAVPIAVIAPLLVLIVLLGVYPKPVIDRITPSVNRLVDRVEQVTNVRQPAVATHATPPARATNASVP